MRTTRRRAAFLALSPFAALIAPRVAASAEGGPDDPRWAHDVRLAQIWRCTFPDCTPHYYDPLLGEPELGIPPGTAFEDLPEDYYCPECGARKKDYMRYRNRAGL